MWPPFKAWTIASTHGSMQTLSLYIWVSMIFMSFTCRGSVAMCWGGVVDFSILADTDASATNLRQFGPHSRLEHLSHSRFFHTLSLYIWVSMIFMSFTCRGSVAMCWGGVVDFSILADTDASATNLRQCGPHSRLEHLSPSRIYPHALFIYMSVHDILEFHK